MRMFGSMRWTAVTAGLLLLVLCDLHCDGTSPRERVVVIGLDGATWEILQPWIDQGDLPTLADLQVRGAWGEMQSVVPYLSPPAWTSAVTGVNPGKHAIFDFQRRLPNQSIIVNETAKNRRAQPIWNVLSAKGKRVLIMNVPMTDPPDEVNGLMIAGFPHLDEDDFTYPRDLAAAIQPYELDQMQMKLTEGEEDSLLEAYHASLDRRTRITLDWLAQEPFDLMWVVFTESDRIQHTFWMFSDPENPHYDAERAARYGREIHDFWVAQDQALAEILAATGPGTHVLLVSDHGFGPLRRDLKVQEYLRRPGGALDEREAGSIYCLDKGDAARLYITRRGRDPQAPWSPEEALAIRERLVGDLLAARNPQTGERLCEAVWTNEEVFVGTYAEVGPDVIALPSEGNFMVLGDVDAKPGSPYLEPHGPFLSGWHKMNGMYVLTGPGIRPGRCDRDPERLFSLIDIVPTLLYLLDEPIPVGLDGGLMESIIDPQVLQRRPPQSGPPWEEDYREMTPEELQNLKNLPYIGG